jgi:peroxiredoxin
VSDPSGGEDEGRAADEGRPSLHRLDPDLAAPQAPAATQPAPPVIDTRPYRWMVGIIGLALVVGISVYQFASHGVGGSTGVAAGHRLIFFAAPLAATNLNGSANAHPTCSAARHDPRALNVCLLARRGPLVLSFFVTGASQCVRQVSALQTLAARFPSVQFAAVAVGASHRATAALIRAHHWTIPVAYDSDGRVGALYGVAVCPMAELADRGGIVRARLIGNGWQSAAALAPRVRELVGGGSAAG